MTKENAHLFLPLVQALAEGKTLQYRDRRTAAWTEPAGRGWWFADPSEDYRIKPEPPAMVPLEAGDVPPGSFFRYNHRETGYDYIAITRVGRGHLYLENFDLTYAHAMEWGEIKRPGEDWQPCSKAVEEVTNE